MNENKVKILILCTGNSCRSQMAEGFMKSFHENIIAFSAGTAPSGEIHPKAIRVMDEIGIDISEGNPKSVDEFINDHFDYVITVCDGAKEVCPVFKGDVKQQLHIGFDDPADATGSEDEIITVFRRVRDEIKKDFYKLYMDEVKPRI